ncbi:MAG TPA: hypothetical protein P5081_10955 [Phycisphaerae bacterium]|nr:hypothetical protein [Phycisphaerae bacterium]HRW53398.1 hypothetical protein [Phycisphaerae bacterium]
MLRNLLIDLLFGLIGMGVGLTFVAGSTYGCSTPEATFPPITHDAPSPHEEPTTPRLRDFVYDISPIFVRILLVGGVVIGLAICVRSLAAMVVACRIYAASQTHPGKPWNWLPAWRRGRLEAPFAQRVFGAGIGLGRLGVALFMLVGSIGINIVEPGIASFALSAICLVFACLLLLMSWIALLGAKSETVWARRLTCRLIEIPAHPGAPLTIAITFDPRFTPQNGIRVRLEDRLRGLSEVETTIEQLPGHIIVRCNATTGEFITSPRIEPCAWRLWLSGRRFNIHYLVPVFIAPPSPSTSP